MNVLHLPLKKEWYEMIKSGVKTEEYREIKPYWISRLLKYADGSKIPKLAASVFAGHPELLGLRLGQGIVVFKKFTFVKFSYGYTRRIMLFKIESIGIGKGNPDWGAPTENVFIIKFGEI